MHSKKQRPVAVDECRVTTERNRIDGVILFAVGTPKQRSAGGDVQRHVTLQLCCANLKDPGRNKHCAATVARAGVDGRLQRTCVQRLAIALRAEVANVVHAGAKIIAGIMLGRLCGERAAAQQSECEGTGRCIAEPLTSCDDTTRRRNGERVWSLQWDLSEKE